MALNLKQMFSLLLIFNILIILFPGLIIGITHLFPEPQIKIYNHTTQQTIKLDREKYLKGVLAAEMPARFSLAALKAQAIAARTYTLKKLQSKQIITTDSTKDQAWISKSKLIAQWGLQDYLQNWLKISSAVEATKGIVLSYNNQLISAVYHSTSGGRTASAEQVWGRKVPYLSSVSSSYETTSPYYKQHYYFSYSQLKKKLNTPSLTANNLQVLQRSPSQRVVQLQAGNSLFSGQEIRHQLNLPSTKFKLTKQQTGLHITTWGYGHGVGLSQYGAQGMAKRGYNYVQILQHYYQQINFSRIN